MSSPWLCKQGLCTVHVPQKLYRSGGYRLYNQSKLLPTLYVTAPATFLHRFHSIVFPFGKTKMITTKLLHGSDSEKWLHEALTTIQDRLHDLLSAWKTRAKSNEGLDWSVWRTTEQNTTELRPGSDSGKGSTLDLSLISGGSWSDSEVLTENKIKHDS